jgi:6-pyruvoyltetrahydropterin/6-carboxytetrahydropterin synthase
MPATLTRIDISKEYLNFSAGHFTIFSATERENLHGHNFQVRCSVTAEVGEDGMAFDYVELKRVLKGLCDELDERVLLPAISPHLRLERDCLPVPIRNVTIEELSALLLARLLDRPESQGWGLRAVELGVSSGLGQWAFAQWESA